MSQYKILWVDDDEKILSSAERLFRFKNWPILTTTSVTQAKEILANNEIAVLISDQRMPEMSGVDFLSLCRENFPDVTRILLTGFLEESVVEDSVNRAKIFRFITKPWIEAELELDIVKAIEYHEEKTHQRRMIKEVAEKNRHLETLTTDLENLVAERTEHIEASKNQVEVNLSNVRKLVLFIKELATLRGLDELMVLLRKEIKKFHGVQAPVFAYTTHDGRKRILYFRRSEVIEGKLQESWDDSGRIRINSVGDQKYLTQQFSRPFSKVIAIPLQRKESLPSILFIENNLSEKEVSEFIEYISQRIQPLSIAIDRVLLEYQATFVSYQWESTFDGIKNPIAIVDEEYNLLRSNKVFSNHRQAQNCYYQLAKRGEKCLGCPVEKSIESGQPSVSKIHVEGKIYNVYSYPIRLDDQMNATHVINYYRDITNERNLYGRVVQNEKLGAIGLLAGNIAHELNNPLTGIRSLSQVLLSEQPEGEQLTEDLKEVEKASKRCQDIIENLLDFSSSDESEQEEFSQASINDIVNNTLPLLKTAMRYHRSEIELSEGVEVKVKVPLLQQVFFNLVNNACQAMKEAGTVRIETTSEKEWVYLSVSDDGVGIPEEMLTNIFEPFFTTKKEGEGTGLGLSMSQSIIESFGGKIHVHSTVGKGTTFKVQLPNANEVTPER